MGPINPDQPTPGPHQGPGLPQTIFNDVDINDLIKYNPNYLNKFKVDPTRKPMRFGQSPASPPAMAMEEEINVTLKPHVKEPLSKTPAGPSAPKPVPTITMEPHSETLPASSETEEFTTVQSKVQKRKLKASKSHANPPKKVGIAAPDSVSQPSTSQATPEEESEDSPMGDPPREKVPPSLHKRITQLAVYTAFIRPAGHLLHECPLDRYMHLSQIPTSGDHRLLTKTLRQENVGFHTYALPDERVLRVVIRVPGLPVQEVHRMYHPRTKVLYEMVLVTLDLTSEGKKVHNITSMCRLTGLKIVPS
ncbi:uncharacterized protein LOC123878417 [Maniola jurtina]|uniref:uncharacterized protein LOC123878417 n=1 Tax=Maniola jurtina TaxID=191418 RepID=UPI001E68DEB8|nr:uncharacterized protein LOC123878417 [Maniola jurtina]